MNAYNTYTETIEGKKVTLCNFIFRGHRSWWAECEGKRIADGCTTRKGIRQDAIFAIKRLSLLSSL